jgi:hypothetical protein
METLQFPILVDWCGLQMIIIENQDRGILRSGCIAALRPQATEE